MADNRGEATSSSRRLFIAELHRRSHAAWNDTAQRLRALVTKALDCLSQQLGGLISDASAYRYLPRSVAYLPEPEVVRRMMADAGFVDVERRLLSGGVAQLICATRATGRSDAV